MPREVIKPVTFFACDDCGNEFDIFEDADMCCKEEGDPLYHGVKEVKVSVTWVLICAKCSTEFDFQGSYSYSEIDYLDDSDEIICPACGCKAEVNENTQDDFIHM